RFHRLFTGAAVIFLASASLARAEDWPQWRGANRDGLSAETGLLDTWPESGPPPLWKAEGIGGGYASPAIAGGKVFGSGFENGEEFVWALSEADGKQLWKTTIAKVGYENIEAKYATGPRATPTVDGDRVYCLGAAGDLACLETESGKLVWSKNLVKDFGGELMSGWGFSEAPLIDGDRLVCTPGGAQGAVAALDKATGEAVWRSKDLADPASYSAVVAAEIGGKKHYVVLTGASLAGIDPENGTVLWRADRAGKSFVVATPIVEGDQVFVTSSDVGSQLFTVTASGGSFAVAETYKSLKLKNDWGGAVKVGDHVYADNGATFVALDFKTGDMTTRARMIGECGVGYAEGHLYLQNPDGVVALVEAKPDALTEKSRFTQPEAEGKKGYAVPTIANGRLYLRALDTLVAYDIKKP
ncbi:MAG: PQQ-like beta-propeller repeat protein, partial [Verrucomicrobiae bacterium]|nr:PQQ-like beta-propeller repeat protein [Verrucomicrobiae bacterium]